MSEVTNEIINMTKYIISPHIDDAFLSLGGSISKWVNARCEVKVIDVFATSIWTNPACISARRYPKNAKIVTDLRRKEEIKAFKCVGIDVKFLRYPDSHVRCLTKKYKMKRLHQNIRAEIAAEIDKKSPCFFPLNLANKIDHKITAEIGIDFLRSGYRVIFYEDFPYMSVLKKRHTNFNNLFKGVKLIPVFEKIDLKKKLTILKYYRSQVSQKWLDCIKLYSGFRKLDGGCYEVCWKPAY